MSSLSYSVYSRLMVALFLALHLSPTAANAQTVGRIWEQRLTGQSLYGSPRKVATDANGDVFVAGLTAAATGNQDLFLAKYSATTGALLWQKSYDGPGRNSDSAEALAIDRFGNVAVTGPSYAVNTGVDYYTAKYSNSGTLLWSKRFSGANSDFDVPHDIAVDSDGNVFVTGESTFFGGVEYYTVKYAAANGAVLWEKRTPNRAYAISVDTAGNAIVAGQKSGANSTDLYTVKYAASNGAVLWEKQTNLLALYGFYYAEVTDVVTDRSDNVILTGRFGSHENQSDFYTVKYAAANGAQLWEKVFSTTRDDYPQAVAVDPPTGDVVVTGYSPVRVGNATTDDFYTVRYAAADGAQLWEKRYGASNTEDRSYAVAIDRAGNVLVTGSSTNTRNRDYVTLKYAGNNGTQLWEQRYNGPADREDMPVGISVDGVGNAIVTGRSENAAGNVDFYTVKYGLPPAAPTVVTLTPTNVSRTSATLPGSVTSNNADSSTYIGRADRPGELQWIPGTPATVPAAAHATFIVAVTDLAPHTSYSVRAIGKNSAGTGFGTSVSFTTLNGPTVAVDDRLHSTTGSELLFDPRTNDSDEDGDALTITAVSGASHGAVTTDGTKIRYVGDATFNGNDTFTYTVSDGFGGSATATVTIVNSPPTAGDHTIHPDFGPGGSTNIDVTSLWGDTDGDPLNISSVTQATYGKVTFTDRRLTYVAADAGFTGNDTFTYTVSDGAGGKATGTITFVNTPPTAGDLRLHPSIGPNSLTTIDLSPIWADADGDSVSISNVTFGSHGQVFIYESTVTYVSGGTFKGNDTFTYTVTDGRGATATNSITFYNSAPVANPDTLQIAPGMALLQVLANDSDADGDTMTITSVSGALFGTLITDGTTVSYTPGAEFQGVDSFSYTITDRRGTFASAQATIKAAYPVERKLAEQGGEIPWLKNAKWRSFGTPSLFAGGAKVGWLGTFSKRGNVSQGIFSGDLNSVELRLRADSPAVDTLGKNLRGTTFRYFKQPVFAGESFAFVAKLGGKEVSPANDSGIWLSERGNLRLIARKDGLAPGTTGARFKDFTSLAMPAEDTVFFAAKLRLKVDGVTEDNDAGLWVWDYNSGEYTTLLREGEVLSLGGKTRRVRSFRVLAPVNGSGGHARYDSETLSVDALIEFKDGATAAVEISADGSIYFVSITGEADSEDVVTVALGMPSSPGKGERPAALATFKRKGAKNPSYKAIVDFASEALIALEKEPAPGTDGATFESFQDPVTGFGLNQRKVIAFKASLRKAKAAENMGIWADTSDEAPELELIAREGAEAPGAPGAKFAAFESLSVLEGRGVVFTARLASGEIRVKSGADRGCWATSSDGSLRLIFREGDSVNGKILRSFSLLGAVPGSHGQRRAWASGDATPSLIYQAFYSDGTQGIVTLAVP